MRSLRTNFSAAVLFWAILSAQFPVLAEGATGDSPDKRFFTQLIEGARKEKQVYLYLISSGSDQVVSGFKSYLQRLGLNIEVKADVTGGSFQKISQAIGETRQGIVPTFDVQYGATHELIHLMEVKGIKRIDNVEPLLSEIAPQALPVLDKLSPGLFSGRAFTFGHWIKAIIYNTKLISTEDLPKTHIELGDPKYKGTFALPPWTTDAESALLVHDKEKALEIVKGIGTNKAATEASEESAVNRVLLGEFKFANANAHYYHDFKGRDSRAPIGLEFFRDYTIVSESMYFLREGARSPNAATLFVLWTMSKEGQEVFEKAASQPNLYLPSSQIGREILGMFKTRKVRAVSWVENEESFKKLRWLAQTEEGKAWAGAIAKAWRGR